MADGNVDRSKRRFLVAASGVMGGVAGVATAVPFVLSMTPSARARAAGAPVEQDISALEPGMAITVEWRGKPVWIIRRTKEMLDSLPKMDDQVADPKSSVKSQQPEYATNENRSIKPEYLVLVGICTHLGCSPTQKLVAGSDDMGGSWPGGFFCPCHGSKFDLAGRVFKGVPAPINLEVPPYAYLSDTRLIIGVDSKGA